jgi:hypothetical protein
VERVAMLLSWTGMDIGLVCFTHPRDRHLNITMEALSDGGLFLDSSERY